MGTALARALASSGYRIEAVVTRKIKHARAAANLINAHTLALNHLQLDRLPPSDIILISTPDDAVVEVAESLAATVKRVRKGQAVLHTSGALSSAALQSLRDAGFRTGSLHPLISVSDAVSGADNLRSAFFCIEGDAVGIRTAHSIVRALGAKSFSIKANQKALYHAAAVMASGHTIALFDIATEMLARCGLTEGRARRLLLPLLKSTLDNLAAHKSQARALTGTFARADVATVRRHLEALHLIGATDAVSAYTLLGQRSLQLAKQMGRAPRALKEIASILEEAERDKH